MIAYKVRPPAKERSLDNENFLDELKAVDDKARAGAHLQRVNITINFGQSGKNPEGGVTVSKTRQVSNHRVWPRSGSNIRRREFGHVLLKEVNFEVEIEKSEH